MHECPSVGPPPLCCKLLTDDDDCGHSLFTLESACPCNIFNNETRQGNGHHPRPGIPFLCPSLNYTRTVLIRSQRGEEACACQQRTQWRIFYLLQTAFTMILVQNHVPQKKNEWKKSQEERPSSTSSCLAERRNKISDCTWPVDQNDIDMFVETCGTLCFSVNFFLAFSQCYTRVIFLCLFLTMSFSMKSASLLNLLFSYYAFWESSCCCCW